LTYSALEGAQGYPILTIRQCLAPRLDSYCTFSCLVLGPDATGIETSLTVAIVHHTGSFAGLRSTMRTINDEGLAAGLAYAVNIGRDEQIVTEEDITSGRASAMIRDVIDEKPPGDKGDLN
jgi:hypothetical protein